MSEQNSFYSDGATVRGPDFQPPKQETPSAVYSSAETTVETVSPAKTRSSIGKNALFGIGGGILGAGLVFGNFAPANFDQDAEKPVPAASPSEINPSSSELGAQLSGRDYAKINYEVKTKAQETLVRAWATDNGSDQHAIISGPNRWGTQSYTSTEIKDGSGKSKVRTVQVNLELIEGVDGNNTVVIEATSDEVCTEKGVDSFTEDEAQLQVDCPVSSTSEKLAYEFSGMHIPASATGGGDMEVRNKILDALELRSTKLTAIEHLVTTTNPSGESVYDASRIEINDDLVARAIGGADRAHTKSELSEVLNADFLDS